MKNYFVTFLSDSPFVDGFVNISAPNYAIAKKMATRILSDKWKLIFSEEDFSRDAFPAGQIGRTIYSIS